MNANSFDNQLSKLFSESGILLSNSVIQEIKNNLDWCVKNTYSDLDDVNFGRCILHSTSLPCTNRMQGRDFIFTQLPPAFNFEKDFALLTEEDGFENSISLYPVYDHMFIYKFNMYFIAVSVSCEIKCVQFKLLYVRVIFR